MGFKALLTNLFLFTVSPFLFQSMHLLTLASYLEERAAKLRREALGRIQVALAGSGSNSMYSTIDSFFGYQTEEGTEASTPVETPVSDALLSQIASAVTGSSAGHTFGGFPCAPIPAHLQTVRGKTDTVISHTSGSETEAAERSKQHTNPAVTKATVFKPGPLERTWTRTGLSQEFLPTNEGGGSYSCPMCPQYQPRSNLDTVATHIRRDHLNISLGCYFCSESFFSSEGWKRHNFQRHGKSKNEYVPAGSEEPGTFEKPNPLGSDPNILIEDSVLTEVKQEEKEAIEEAAGLSRKENLDIESDFVEEMEIVEV